jgi:3-oxoadipate enol-lactonase
MYSLRVSLNAHAPSLHYADKIDSISLSKGDCMPNSVTLSFSEQGRGLPIILLHGFPLSSAIWHQQQNWLSDHYRVITPDLRGHGKSPAPDGIYDMESLARDVLALMDSLRIDKAVIMGHSMGGYVTFALWRLASERFTALGLVASQPNADSEEAQQGRYSLAERVFVNGSSAVAEAMLPRLFSPDLEKDDPNTEQVRMMITNTRPTGIMGTLRGMAIRPDSRGLLSDIKIPTLIISGDKDQIIPLNRAEDMAASMPNATLVTIEDAGHLPMLEQPQAVTLSIRNFLAEVYPPTNT